MPNARTVLVCPLLIIAVGVGWLLNVYGIVPQVNWLLVVLLAALGMVTFLIGGINKITFVVGPILLAASLFTALEQMGKLDVTREIPYLVILLGFFWLVAELLKLRVPEWLQKEQEPPADKTHTLSKNP